MQVSCSGMGFAGTQYIGENLCLIATVSALPVMFPVLDGTIEQQAFVAGVVDEMPVCKLCKAPAEHEVVTYIPLCGELEDLVLVPG